MVEGPGATGGAVARVVQGAGGEAQRPRVLRVKMCLKGQVRRAGLEEGPRGGGARVVEGTGEASGSARAGGGADARVVGGTGEAGGADARVVGGTGADRGATGSWSEGQAAAGRTRGCSKGQVRGAGASHARGGVGAGREGVGGAEVSLRSPVRAGKGGMVRAC